jgi:hypothetical protein
MEKWIQIQETDCRYSVSNLGNVKKNREVIMRDNGRKQILNEKILKSIPNIYGYLKVRCSLEDRSVKNIYIHRLVAKYFLENNNSSLQVNHKNGVKIDNNVENLEWVTVKENIRHAWDMGLSKPTNCKKIAVGEIHFNTIVEASKYLGVGRDVLPRTIEKGYYIKRNQPIIYDGVEYNSLKEASRAVGLNPKTIKKYGSFVPNEKISVKFI